MASDDQQTTLAALDKVPPGARVLSLVQLNCVNAWPLPRNSHLGAMVMVRKQGFSNDQWVMEGMNLLQLRYPKAGRYAADPSNLIRPNWCRDGLHRTVDDALAGIPPGAFDYVWLIDPPAYDPRLVERMQLVWRGPNTILYRTQP